MTRDTSEQTFENRIGNLLRIGVVTAATVVLAGGIWLLLTTGSQTVAFSAFRGEPPQLRSPGAIVADLFAGDSRALVQLGLLILIATPVARVVFSLLGFFVRKDRLYVVVTLTVLAALLFSLIAG